MLAITFLFPAILYAAGAAAAPVIIHLIMRTKPRRIIFPALRFVKKTHNANLSKLRLKHLILLLMRMAVIALIAFLIARWQIPSWKSTAKNSTPVAAVVIIDNSGSMTARQAGQSLLNKGKALASQLVDQFPSGSKIALLDSACTYGGEFLADRKLLAQQVADIPSGMGKQDLSAAIARAESLLVAAKMSPRELYIITDMAEHVWHDVPPQKSLTDVRTTILDCGLGQDTNVAIGEIKLESNVVPVGVTVPLQTTVTAPTVGGDMVVQTELDGKAVDEQTIRLTPGMPSTLEVGLRPQREGVLHGRVILQHTDALEMDNVRYFTLLTHAMPGMLLVTDNTTDMTYYIMIRAVSPGGGRTWVRCDTVANEPLTADQLSKAKVVMLANKPSPADGDWRALEKFVKEGGHLWVVAGPLMSAQAYNSSVAQQLMPVTLKAIEQIDKGVAWQGAGKDEPMLQPFTGDENGALSDVTCKMRFSLQSTAADARVVLRYADGTPAILSKPVGAGSVLFWNFTPDPQYFSPTGFAQLEVLTLRTIHMLVGDSAAQTSFYFGQEATIPLPKLMKNPVITVRRPGSSSEEPLLPDFRRGLSSLRADRLGHYNVRMTEAPRVIDAGFSVNAAVSESRLAPAQPQKVLELFPPESSVILKEVRQIAEQRQMVSQPLDMAVPMLLAMLALLTGEAYFANRFYKQPSAPADAPAPPASGPQE